jgi:hypothetical protein
MSLQKQVANDKNNSSPPFTDEPCPLDFEGMAISFLLPSVATEISFCRKLFLMVAVIVIT